MMRDTSRIAYAQARVQARFSLRPHEAFWRELEAGRDLPHLVEFIRGSGLRDTSGLLGAALGAHAMEARLRTRWLASCEEVAAWYPASWRPAMRWLGWLPWIAPLGWLAHQGEAAPWMDEDVVLREFALAATEDRPASLPGGAPGPLEATRNPDGDLAATWHAHWRDSWPETDRGTRRGLERLAGAVESLLPGGTSLRLDPLVDATEDTARRLFRRHAGTPVAGLALIVLSALDYLRLRGALAVARSFGQAPAS